jgi:hypothetical protein
LVGNYSSSVHKPPDSDKVAATPWRLRQAIPDATSLADAKNLHPGP